MANPLEATAQDPEPDPETKAGAPLEAAAPPSSGSVLLEDKYGRGPIEGVHVKNPDGTWAQGMPDRNGKRLLLIRAGRGTKPGAISTIGDSQTGAGKSAAIDAKSSIGGDSGTAPGASDNDKKLPLHHLICGGIERAAVAFGGKEALIPEEFRNDMRASAGVLLAESAPSFSPGQVFAVLFLWQAAAACTTEQGLTRLGVIAGKVSTWWSNRGIPQPTPSPTPTPSIPPGGTP